jgi:hypothetical protein
MARIVYQGQDIILPDSEMDGEQLFRELQVPPERDLIVVRAEGNLLLNRRRKLRPVEGDYFVDAPIFEYG